MNDIDLNQKDSDVNTPNSQNRIKQDQFNIERLQLEDELEYLQQDHLEKHKQLGRNNVTHSKLSKNSTTQLYPENQANVYDYLIQFKEKNNQLQLRLNDVSKFKIELDTKNKKISELEKNLSQHKIEIKRLQLKIEENIKQNQNWEISFREFKGKIIKLEEEKINLNDAIDKWRVKYEDLEFKNEILKEKFKLNEENIQNLKKIQTEYENAQIDLKKEFKIKEENLKKKFEEITQNVENRLKETELENSKEKQKLQETIKQLEKEISKKNDQIEEVNSNIEDLQRDFIDREKEFNNIIEEKDVRISELENDFKTISYEANSHIMKLNENISEINEKIKQKEISFLNEMEILNSDLEDEKEKNLNLEKLNEELKIKIKEKNQNHQNNISAIENEKSLRTNRNGQSEKNIIDPNYVKKIENELNILKKILGEKQEEVDRLQHDMNRTLISLNNSDYIKNNMKIGKNEFGFAHNFENLKEQNNFLQNEIKKKEEENEEIKRKFNQLRKYCKDLEEIKENLEKAFMEIKYELNKKNEEVYLLKVNYDKIIQEFQEKLDIVLI
jgi:myosin heavy subunit